MGSPSYSTLRHWRTEALTGRRIGPRIVAPGPILTMGDPYFWEMVSRGPEEGRRAVDQLTEEGVDFIKITQTLDRDTYFAVADEARKLNMTLSGHLPVADDGIGFKVSGIEASNAGQKSLEHLHGIPLPFEKQDPALIPTLLKNGTWIVPTLTTYYARAHVHELAEQTDPRLTHIAPGFKQFWDAQLPGYSKSSAINEKIFDWRSGQVLAMFAAGVPLLAGTDLGFAYIFPGDIVRELELFVKAGLPPVAALRTATLNPARYLKLDDVLGSIEAGKIADLVLLTANPLDDVGNLRKVDAVVLNGRYFDRTQLDAIVPTFK
jgi:imidazolonepropionase-like amidohydrolase